VGGGEVSDLATLYRRIWSRGAAGVDIPLTIYREGRTFEQSVPSSDRNRFFKPRAALSGAPGSLRGPSVAIVSAAPRELRAPGRRRPAHAASGTSAWRRGAVSAPIRTW